MWARNTEKEEGREKADKNDRVSQCGKGELGKNDSYHGFRLPMQIRVRFSNPNAVSGQTACSHFPHRHYTVFQKMKSFKMANTQIYPLNPFQFSENILIDLFASV